MNTLFRPSAWCMLLIGHMSAPALNAQALEWMDEETNPPSSEKNAELLFNLQKETDPDPVHMVKINLNELSIEMLQQFDFLNAPEKKLIIEYLENLKPLISPLELQSIPGIPLNKIKRLILHSTVYPDKGIMATANHSDQNQGHYLVLRWNRKLETPNHEEVSDSSASRVLGSEDKVLLKFRGHTHLKWRYGLTAEKDAGESWLTSSSVKLPDFLSAYIEYKNPGATLQQLIIGDYSLSLGLGLLLDNASFAGGLPDFRITFNTRYASKPYTSTGENEMLRGVCAQLNLLPSLLLQTYLSYNYIDTKLDSVATQNSILKQLKTIRYQESGLHSTSYELANRKNQSQLIGGCALICKKNQLEIGMHGMYTGTQYEMANSVQPDRLFIPDQSKLLFGSGFYNLHTRNVYLTGEFAFDSKRNTSFHQSMIAGMGKRAEFAGEFYRYGPGFYARLSQANTPNGKSWNHTGYALQFNLTLMGSLKLGLAYEYSHRQWDVTNGPYQFIPTSYYRLKINHEQRKKWQFKTQIELRSLPEYPDVEQPTPNSTFMINRQLAITLFYEMTLSRSTKWRSRIHWKHVNTAGQRASGFFCSQDFLYKPLASRVHLNGRIAFFDNGQSSLKLFVFENDVMYHYGIHSHSGSGLRYYLNIRYKPIRSLNIEVKLARTLEIRAVERSPIPFGDRNASSDATLQLSYEF